MTCDFFPKYAWVKPLKDKKSILQVMMDLKTHFLSAKTWYIRIEKRKEHRLFLGGNES